MGQMETMTDGYARYCEGRGIAASTLEGRIREIDRFGLWIRRRKVRIGLPEVRSEHIVDYLRSRTRFRSKSTVSGVMSHLRCFGEYLLQERVWRENCLRWLQGPRIDPRHRLPRRIGRDQLGRLFTEASRAHRRYHRHLWLALLAVLYGTGLRRGELERLDLKDFDRSTGLLRIDGRKTGRERQVPVPDVARRLLEAYLPHRYNALVGVGGESESALFVTALGARLTGERIGVSLHLVARRAGVPLATAHQFRHSCASDLMEAGVGIPEIQRILGHASVGSTFRYAQVADPERVSAMVSRHPINDILRIEEQEGRHEDRQY